MNISQQPDALCILKITDGDHVYYKLFASWRSDDRWKINSGVSGVTEDENYYYFYGFTGSCYQCAKGFYGTATFYNSMILDNIIEKSDDMVELMDKKTDWVGLIGSGNEI